MHPCSLIFLVAPPPSYLEVTEVLIMSNLLDLLSRFFSRSAQWLKSQEANSKCDPSIFKSNSGPHDFQLSTHIILKTGLYFYTILFLHDSSWVPSLVFIHLSTFRNSLTIQAFNTCNIGGSIMNCSCMVCFSTSMFSHLPFTIQFFKSFKIWVSWRRNHLSLHFPGILSIWQKRRNI